MLEEGIAILHTIDTRVFWFIKTPYKLLNKNMVKENKRELN